MIDKIIKMFNLNGELINVSEINSGIINNTYVAEFKEKDGNIKRYLIQRINTTVFTQPFKLMKNIENVTTYLRKEQMKEGDKEHQILEIIRTKDGKNLGYIEENGERSYYRVYDFIENAISYNHADDAKIVYNAGKAFGNFQRLLRNFPMVKLYETIPNFHNTPKRYNDLINDVILDPEGRVDEVTKEIIFLLTRRDDYGEITEKLGTEDVPIRVTHNDTKVSNVMMNKQNGDYLAVIDLDTVMPGSMLYDYGDGIRSIAITAPESEKDLSKVDINLEYFKSFTDGYLSEMAPYITDSELSLMGESIRIITLELAIRFLDDYINGDAYFKTRYKKHNLDRARNQMKLAQKIEEKMEYINSYIFESYKEHKQSNGYARKLTKK